MNGNSQNILAALSDIDGRYITEADGTFNPFARPSTGRMRTILVLAACIALIAALGMMLPLLIHDNVTPPVTDARISVGTISATITPAVQEVELGTTPTAIISNFTPDQQTVLLNSQATPRWQASSTSDGEFNDMSGANDFTLTAEQMNITEAGTYYYRLVVTVSSTDYTSDVISVTVTETESTYLKFTGTEIKNGTATTYWKVNDTGTGIIAATGDDYDIRYDDGTSTLTLNNVNIAWESQSALILSNGDLNIVLVGSNTLKDNYSYGKGIYLTAGNLTISGGSLTVNSSQSCIQTYGSITINDCTVKAVGHDDIIYSDRSDAISITDSVVTAEVHNGNPDYTAIRTDRGTVTVSNSSISASASQTAIKAANVVLTDYPDGYLWSKISIDSFTDSNTTPYTYSDTDKYMEIRTRHPSYVRIAGTDVRSKNRTTYWKVVNNTPVAAADSDFDISYDDSSYTLTLKNITVITEWGDVIEADGNLHIVLVGKNTLDVCREGCLIDVLYGNLTLSGGTLTDLPLYYSCINALGSITIKDCVINANCIHSISTSEINITDSTVVTTKSGMGLLAYDGVITISNSAVTAGGSEYGIYTGSVVLSGYADGYRWRTSETDSFTGSNTAAYTYAKDNKYVEIRPTAEELPVITSISPATQVAVPGIFFHNIEVNALGNDLSYTWYYYDSTDTTPRVIPGFVDKASSCLDRIPDWKSGTVGSIYCVVSNGSGSVTSDTVRVNVTSVAELPVTEPVSPASQSALIGPDGYLSKQLTVGTSTEYTAYKWYRYINGDISTLTLDPMTNNSDTFFAIYRVGGSPEEYDGTVVSYLCIMTNEEGAFKSETATVTALAADESAKPAVISITPRYQVVICGEEMAELTVSATGVDLVYNWYVKIQQSYQYELHTRGLENTFSYSAETLKSRYPHYGEEPMTFYCIVENKFGKAITEEVTVIVTSPDHVHSPVNPWWYNATVHRGICECGQSLDAAHTYGEWTVTKAATETAEGICERTCTVCGFRQTGTIDVSGNPHATDGGSPATVCKGDRVKLAPGAAWSNGRMPSDWVYNSTLVVLSVDADAGTAQVSTNGKDYTGTAKLSDLAPV